MKKVVSLVLAVFILQASAALAGALPVMVSVAPQKYFVEKLAGPLAQVSVMVTPGADAHSFEPKPSQMAQAGSAKIYFAQGVEFEQVWLGKMTASNPGLRVVDVNAGIALLPLSGHDGHGHAKGRHAGKETDPHTWTSPRLAAVQAAAMAEALIAADPANENTYRANLEAFRGELTQLDAEIRQALEGVRVNAAFIVFHPGWAYFAKEYKLVEMPIEVGGKEPGPRQLKRIIEKAVAGKVKAIFVQPQFSRVSAQTVADAAGAQLVEADDLAPDWAQNLKRVAQSLGHALR